MAITILCGVTSTASLTDKKVTQMKTIAKSVNRALHPVTSLKTVAMDVAQAKIADNNARLAGEKSTTAFKIMGKFKGAQRKMIKERAVASVREVIDGSPGTFGAELPEIGHMHRHIQDTLFEIREHVIRWDGMNVDMPYWQIWTFLGKDDEGRPEFEIDEIWDYDEFVEFVSHSAKFKKDTAKWVIEDTLKAVNCPILKVETDFDIEVWERIEKSLIGKLERDTEAGKETWDFEKFYKGGIPLGELTDKPNITSVLAFIGRVVAALNNKVDQMSYRLGNALYGNDKAGMEARDSELEIMGHTLSISSAVNEGRYIVEDREWNNLEAEIEESIEAIEAWVDEWKVILPEQVLEVLDTFYHGGYIYSEGPNGEDRFKLKKFEFKRLTSEVNAESFHKEAEERLAKAIEADNKALSAYIAKHS